MLAILNSLNAHNFPNFEPILVILVSKFMVHRVLSDKSYLSLGLLSPFKLLALWTKSTSSLRWPSLRSSPCFIRCTPGIGLRSITLFNLH